MRVVPFLIEAGTGAGATYIPVPADHTVLGFDVTPSAVTGCTSTVSAISGSTTVGSAAIGAAGAAGTIVNGTMSTTLATRKTKVSKTVPLKMSVDARTNSTAIFGSVYLDEFALQSD
jgi:hypothetical protein